MPSFVPRLAVLAIAVLAALAPAQPAAASTRAITASAERNGTVVFKLRDLRARSIRFARVRAGRYRRGVSLPKVRRATRRGVLKVRLPRRYRGGALRARMRALVRRRGVRLRLSVGAPAAQSRRGRRVRERLGSLETGDFSDFDNRSTSAGTLTTTTERAYDGTHAAKITSDGSPNNSFQRVWYDVDWQPGADVWYGMALYIPKVSDWCWWRPVRWDNHSLYGGSGDVGGVRIEQGKLFLDSGRYGEAAKQLTGGAAVPEGRWFWLEVHQRLSAQEGQALSELYLDGNKIGASSAPNSSGRPITNIRYGNVTLASDCSRASSVYFDRVSLANGARGPVS
ncbi:MAG: polysaccharide lyase [Actinomycetota bacterium]|nr:polysaccharide lyase [Actinomycetota bacterium]